MAQTAVKNGQRNIANLEKEVKLLRSFLIGMAGRDKEGNYRPEFVRKILKAIKGKGRFVFKDKSSFLAYLQK